jgi:hypothetical protein
LPRRLFTTYTRKFQQWLPYMKSTLTQPPISLGFILILSSHTSQYFSFFKLHTQTRVAPLLTTLRGELYKPYSPPSPDISHRLDSFVSDIPLRYTLDILLRGNVSKCSTCRLCQELLASCTNAHTKQQRQSMWMRWSEFETKFNRMYVVCVCLCTCMFVRTYVLRMYVCTSVRMYVRMYVCMHVALLQVKYTQATCTMVTVPAVLKWHLISYHS